MKIGVKMGFGTDAGAFEHGTSAREFVKMVEYGVMGSTQSARRQTRAAELLRMEKQIGSIQKSADSRDIRDERREGVQVAVVDHCGARAPVTRT